MRHEPPHGANNYGEVELALADLSDGGGAGVEDTLWKTRCGRHAVEDTLWKTRCGRRAVEDALWKTRCGRRAVEDAPSQGPATVSADVDETRHGVSRR